MRTISWIDARGTCERGSGGRSWINRKEAEMVAGHVAKILPSYQDGKVTLDIISPFRPQTELIKNLLKDIHPISLQDLPHLLIGISHAFQGDESDIIVFSPVVSSEMDDFPIKIRGRFQSRQCGHNPCETPACHHWQSRSLFGTFQHPQGLGRLRDSNSEQWYLTVLLSLNCSVLSFIWASKRTC